MASCLDVCKKDSDPVVQQRIVKSMVGTCASNTFGGDGPIANELLSFLAQLEDVSEKTLEGCANEFFNKLYPVCSVQFHPKPNGVQFGRIAHVTTSDGMRKFFIIVLGMHNKNLSQSSRFISRKCSSTSF